MFAGRSVDSESTVLPSISSWVQETFLDMVEVRSFDDHGLILWANMTTAGIVGAAKYEFILTALTNLLTLYKRNGVAVVIHPNRASQLQVPNRTESIDYWYPILVY